MTEREEEKEEQGKINGKRRKVSLLQVPEVSHMVDVFLVVGVYQQFLVLTFSPEFLFIPHLCVAGRGVPKPEQILCCLRGGAGTFGTIVVKKQ